MCVCVVWAAGRMRGGCPPFIHVDDALNVFYRVRLSYHEGVGLVSACAHMCVYLQMCVLGWGLLSCDH